MALAWIIGAEIAASIALLGLGAVTAWASANAVKRVAGVHIALLGACLSIAAIGAPSSFVIGAIAVSLAHLALGLCIVVRMQESYGLIEAPEIDAADRAEPEAAEGER